MFRLSLIIRFNSFRKLLDMNRLGGVYRDENVVCSTSCEIYIPSSLPDTGQGTSAVKCELHSFGRCDIYLIQSTGRSMKEMGSILDIPGQQKVRMDLDLNNILNDNLHYSTKDQYWYEFSRRYGAKERSVTVHFCKEDQQCDQFLNFLHVTFNTMEECKRRGITPENTYRLIALEITGKVCLGDSRASTFGENETYIYETAWDSVLDIQFAKEDIPLEEEHAVFTHIVSHDSVPKPISISADKHSERASVSVMNNMNVVDKLQSSGQMDRYLQCQKCSQTFAKENRHPRLLPCLHSLCSQCLEQQVSTVHMVQCPECDVKYDDIDEIRNFPKDNTRFDLMEYLHLREESYMPNCTICPEIVATHRCTRCAEWLCHPCHEAHQRVTATKKHPLLSLDEVKRAKNLEVFKKSVMCRRHSQSCLNFYYTSECFMAPMCATCALEKNDRKGVHKIEEAAKKKRLEMARLKDTVEKVRSDVTETIKRIQSEKTNIKEHADIVNEYVDTTFEELILVLEKGKAELKSDLKKSVNLKLKMLEEQTKELVELQKKMEEAEDLASLVLVSPNSLSVMQMEKTITQRLDKLAKKSFDASPRELATFGFYKDDLMLKLTQVVADNAQIWSSAISPGKSVTIVDETYLEDDSVRFTLIPQDYRGIPIKIDTAVMKATIEDPKENTINCVLTPRQDDYSLVDVTAEIKSLGRHLLRIYMGDNLVATTAFDRTRVYLRSTLPLGMAQKVISLDLDETDV